MKNNLVKSVAACFLTLITASTFADDSNDPTTEKCYGIVKKGLNDCQTKMQSCAGSAVKDRQPDAFVFVPKGLCDKIVGGSLTPIENDTSPHK